MIDTSNYEVNKTNLEAYGFKIIPWSEFVTAPDRPTGLFSRAIRVTTECRGDRQWVVYDPSDDEEGWLLVGERDEIAKETVEDIIEREPTEGPLAKPKTFTNLYSVDLMIAATVYIKADTLEEAQTKLGQLHHTALELREDRHQQLPITGCSYDNPQMPKVSLSPAMTVHVEQNDIDALELNEEGVPA